MRALRPPVTSTSVEAGLRLPSLPTEPVSLTNRLQLARPVAEQFEVLLDAAVKLHFSLVEAERSLTAPSSVRYRPSGNLNAMRLLPPVSLAHATAQEWAPRLRGARGAYGG